MRRAAPLLLVLLMALVLALDLLRTRPDQGPRESCLVCHDQVSDPDPSHPVAALGCAACHLGNPHSLDKDRAHAGLVLNPGDLRTAAQTCGRSDCHPEVVPRVKSSIMATNQGILNTLYYHWETGGQPAAAPRGVAAMLEDPERLSLAEDQFAKMCASCHLWKERAEGGEIEQRGGGCSACHVVQRTRTDEDPSLASFEHARLSTRVPAENCLRCHNRSARQGLSYQGRFESEGYGTPYHRGAPGTRRLSGGRYFLEGPPDIHFEKGMTCIDCHTHLELMGDGQAHEYLEEQTEISCSMCHEPTFEPIREGDGLARTLTALNRAVPEVRGTRIAYSPSSTPLYHLRSIAGRAVLFRKLDGKPIVMEPTDLSQPQHTLPGHERLSCQACHSRIMPQCYGCHLEYRRDELQEDKISGRETRGRWKEGRSYMRLRKPVLGIDGDEVVPYAPCQVFVSVFDRRGRHQPSASKAITAMTPFDPHTTRPSSRSCLECHLDPKTLGLGQGRLLTGPEGIAFDPLYDAAASHFGMASPPEAFLSLNGTQLQTASRADRRSWTRAELEAILRPAPCLSCHDQYSDPIYDDFSRSLRWLRQGRAETCPANGAGG